MFREARFRGLARGRVVWCTLSPGDRVPGRDGELKPYPEAHRSPHLVCPARFGLALLVSPANPMVKNSLLAQLPRCSDDARRVALSLTRLRRFLLRADGHE